jgi:hypothetical protein
MNTSLFNICSQLFNRGTQLIDAPEVFEFFSRGKERREEKEKLILFYFQKSIFLCKTVCFEWVPMECLNFIVDILIYFTIVYLVPKAPRHTDFDLISSLNFFQVRSRFTLSPTRLDEGPRPVPPMNAAFTKGIIQSFAISEVITSKRVEVTAM